MAQAIGVSRGGRNTKIHALSDGAGRPIAFLLTGGNAADAPQAAVLLENLQVGAMVMADKAYDANAIRRFIESRGAVPNIPFKANRRWKGCFSPFLYRARNAVERMFCRLKDFRRIATRYDRDERRLLRLQKQLATVELLIIDELGFVPLSKTGAELLFELISQRYERGATVITSNLPFDEWTAAFGDERLTGALLDRLTHHVHILEMNAPSYRLAQSRARKAK